MLLYSRLGCQTGPKQRMKATKIGKEQKDPRVPEECRHEIWSDGSRRSPHALQSFGPVLLMMYLCGGDSKTFLALTKAEVHGLINICKKECLHHVQKRMNTALQNLAEKPKSGQPFAKKILRMGSQDQRRNILTTYHHIASTNDDPYHDLSALRNLVLGVTTEVRRQRVNHSPSTDAAFPKNKKQFWRSWTLMRCNSLCSASRFLCCAPHNIPQSISIPSQSRDQGPRDHDSGSGNLQN